MRRGSERLLQALACTRQSRHHGADWNSGDLRDLLVGHPLKLTHDDDFAELLGQFLKRTTERLTIATPFQQVLRIRRFRLGTVDLIVEFGLHFAPSASFEARIAGVAQDREQPNAAIATPKAADKTECA